MKIITAYGELSKVTEFPNSITLSSALLSAITYIADESKLDLIIEEFLSNDPPYVTSDVMLFSEEENTRIYPAPLHDFLGLSDVKFNTLLDYRHYKELKRIKYIPENLLISILNGEVIKSNQINYLLEFNRKINSRIYQVNTAHTAISRVSGKAAEGLLYSNIVHRIIDLRVFFYIAYKEKFEKEILSGIRLLSDLGIGGKKTWGLGKIENLEIKDDYPPELFDSVSGNENYVYLLSSISTNPQIILDKSYYNIHYRRAMISNISSPYIKKGYYYLTSGSIIKISEKLKKIKNRLIVLGRAIESGTIIGRRIIEIGWGLGILARCPE